MKYFRKIQDLVKRGGIWAYNVLWNLWWKVKGHLGIFQSPLQSAAMWVNSQSPPTTHPTGACSLFCIKKRFLVFMPLKQSCAYVSSTNRNNSLYDTYSWSHFLVFLSPTKACVGSFCGNMLQHQNFKRTPFLILILVLLVRNVQCAFLIRFGQLEIFSMNSVKSLMLFNSTAPEECPLSDGNIVKVSLFIPGDQTSEAKNENKHFLRSPQVYGSMSDRLEMQFLQGE